jgi:hypothetical protein
MILRHAGALGRAIGRKAGIVLRPGKEFPGGNLRVTATAQDDDARMADISKVLRIDIPSGNTRRAQE